MTARRLPLPARTPADVCTECGPDCECRPLIPNRWAAVRARTLTIRLTSTRTAP